MNTLGQCHSVLTHRIHSVPNQTRDSCPKILNKPPVYSTFVCLTLPDVYENNNYVNFRKESSRFGVALFSVYVRCVMWLVSTNANDICKTIEDENMVIAPVWKAPTICIL